MNPKIASPVEIALTLDGQPDWEKLTDDVLCPLCDYSLRFLTQPRCPECGYQFHWWEVFERARRPKFSFAHDVERPLSSFVVTLFRSTWPPSLWRVIRPTVAIADIKERIYWISSTLLFFPVYWILSSPFAFESWHYNNSYYTYSAYWSLADTDSIFLLSVFAYLCWLIAPRLTLWTMELFPQTIAMAKIKREHIVRCTRYAFDAGWMLAIALAISSANVQQIRFHLWSYRVRFQGGLPILVAINALCIFVIATWRLHSAFKHYLRFPHAFAAAVASQVIVLLALLLLASVLMRM